MAADTTAVAELLKEHFETPFTDAMDRDIFVLQRFGRDNGVGTEVQWKVHYAGNDSAGSYNEATTVSSVTPGEQSYDQARIPFRQNWIHVQVTGLAQAATQGAGGYMEALSTETAEALDDLKDELNDQLVKVGAKSAATDLDSFDQIIADTGVYATIDRSGADWWKSAVLENSGTPRALSVTLMQNMMVQLELPARKAKPSAIFGSRKHYYDYGNILTEQRRYVNEDTLDGGYKALDFEGIPFIAVPRLTSGSIYFLDESEWKYVTLQNFETTPKDTDYDADRFMITHYSALVCKHPGRQGRIDDLTTV